MYGSTPPGGTCLPFGVLHLAFFKKTLINIYFLKLQISKQSHSAMWLGDPYHLVSKRNLDSKADMSCIWIPKPRIQDSGFRKFSMISKFGFPNVWFQTKIARDNYNSTTIILRPFWIPINQFVISIPKHSFCNTVCICVVIQIKLVVVVVVDQEIKVPRFIDELSSRIRDRVKWSRKRFQGRRELFD